MKTNLVILALVAAFSLWPSARLHAATTIDAVNRYAYGANIGWMDWRGDTNNGVIIGTNVCSGYIYTANFGWINLGSGSPTNGSQYQNLSANDFGVNLDGSGNLRGYAYGANLGWIAFEATGAPKVDLVTGNLSGYVWSANWGWISLSNAVAHVQTSVIQQGPPPVPIFTDGFSSSTLNSASPAAPTPTSTSYELISSKTWNPAPSIAAGHLQFGIAATSGGTIEVQALFTNSPVTLATVGDSLSLTVTFTNTAGLLTGLSYMGFGLYESGQNYPVPGGLNGTATAAPTNNANATGNAQAWVGYVGQLAFTGNNSQIMTRPPQTGTNNNNQDLVTSGSSSDSYYNPKASTIGTASSTPSVTLTVGNPYTEVLTITLAATNTLAITNSLYSGTDTNGTLLSQFGGVASGTNYLTNSFDALAVGWRERASSATMIDINQISVNAALTLSGTPTSPPATAPKLVGITNGSSGFGFCFTNVPAASFTVWATTNLTQPFSNWTVLGHPIEATNGSYSQYQFTDPQATNKSTVRRFYRVSSP